MIFAVLFGPSVVSFFAGLQVARTGTLSARSIVLWCAGLTLVVGLFVALVLSQAQNPFAVDPADPPLTQIAAVPGEMMGSIGKFFDVLTALLITTFASGFAAVGAAVGFRCDQTKYERAER